MAWGLWLDLTGVEPGSDAAVLAQRLAPALQRRLVDRLILCRRDRGLQRLSVADLSALTPPLPAVHPPSAWRSRLGTAAAGLPQPTRMVMRRAWTAQRRALQSLRPARTTMPQAAAADTETAKPGDWLLCLRPYGNLEPLHRQGMRLALLTCETRSRLRPELLPPSAFADAAAWQQFSAPLVSATLSLAAPGTSVSPSHRRSLPPPGFILADGEIGLAGATPNLLLAWRRLLDEGAPLPHLVLAGPTGTLAHDTLAQLRDSDGFGGTVHCVPDPDEGERAALRAACRFVLAPEPLSDWGRATLDSRAAGIPCVSAFAGDVAPASPASLAKALRTALTDPPRPLPAPSHSWDDAADAVLEGLGA